MEEKEEKLDNISRITHLINEIDHNKEFIHEWEDSIERLRSRLQEASEGDHWNSRSRIISLINKKLNFIGILQRRFQEGLNTLLQIKARLEISESPEDIELVDYINLYLGIPIPAIGCINEECSMCLESLILSPDEEGLICQLPCGHCFHDECIRTWLNRQQRCPLCKKDIKSLTFLRCVVPNRVIGLDSYFEE